MAEKPSWLPLWLKSQRCGPSLDFVAMPGAAGASALTAPSNSVAVEPSTLTLTVTGAPIAGEQHADSTTMTPPRTALETRRDMSMSQPLSTRAYGLGSETGLLAPG